MDKRKNSLHNYFSKKLRTENKVSIINLLSTTELLLFFFYIHLFHIA